ncbi:MAG: acyl carrier protein [Myxococcota bacterium]|jgi:acyl carrier protein
MPSAEDIKKVIKNHILEQFLPGEDPDELTDDVELMTMGILDSISIMQLVTFLEEKFDVTFEAHELGVDHMNTLADISKLVASKL